MPQLVVRNIEEKVVRKLRTLSGDTGIPYQNLINLYLLDCAKEQRRLALTWNKIKS